MDLIHNSLMPNKYAHRDSIIHGNIKQLPQISAKFQNKELFTFTQTNTVFGAGLSLSQCDIQSHPASERNMMILDEKTYNTSKSQKNIRIGLPELDYKKIKRAKLKTMGVINHNEILTNNNSGQQSHRDNSVNFIPKSKTRSEDINAKMNISQLQKNSAEVLKKYLDYLNYTDRNSMPDREHGKYRIEKYKNRIIDNEDNINGAKSPRPKRSKRMLMPIIHRQDIIAKEKSVNLETKDSMTNNYSDLVNNNRQYRHSQSILKTQSDEKDFVTMGSNTEKGYNEYKGLDDYLIKDISSNIRELALSNLNENQTANIIDRLANKNNKILEIVSPKTHKLSDYDLHKLEKKLKSVEVINHDNTHGSFVFPKLRKTENIVIDKNIAKQLQDFNENLEQYNIQQKTESLRNIQEALLKIYDKISVDEVRVEKLLKKPELRNISKNRPNINIKSLIQPKQFRYSIIDGVNEFEEQYGEMKLVKRKNISESKVLEDLNQKWISASQN